MARRWFQFHTSWQTRAADGRSGGGVKQILLTTALPCRPANPSCCWHGSGPRFEMRATWPVRMPCFRGKGTDRCWAAVPRRDSGMHDRPTANSHGLAFLSVSTSRHRSSRSLFVVVPCLVCCLYLLWVALFLIHALFAASSSSSCFVVNVKSDSSGRNLIVASSVSMSREFQGAAHFGRLYFQLGSRGPAGAPFR